MNHHDVDWWESQIAFWAGIMHAQKGWFHVVVGPRPLEVGLFIILFGTTLIVGVVQHGKLPLNSLLVNQILKIPTTTRNHPYCVLLGNLEPKWPILENSAMFDEPNQG